MSRLELVEVVCANAVLTHLLFTLVSAESKAETVIAAKEVVVNNYIDNYIVNAFASATPKSKICAVLKPRAADG